MYSNDFLNTKKLPVYGRFLDSYVISHIPLASFLQISLASPPTFVTPSDTTVAPGFFPVFRNQIP